MNNDFLRDSAFLKELDKYINKFYYVKITVLNWEERPISAIEGRVQQGASISLDGSSSMRRTCNLTFVALEEENDLTNIENLLSINKKIKIEVGIKNNMTTKYDNDIFWFPQGVFVIVNPSISHSTSGCTISLTCKDKMALLNGECGGILPGSITFHNYEQVIGFIDVKNESYIPKDNPNDYTVYIFPNKTGKRWTKADGWVNLTETEIENLKSNGEKTVTRPNLIFDIIQTLVCNYGGESINNIIINDVPLEIKQLVRNTSSQSIYYNPEGKIYLIGEGEQPSEEEKNKWLEFKTGEDCGYVYTDFIYPGELVSGIGENICSVLDKIKNTLGNYEYFYDLDGNFVFQEIKNYLNNAYSPITLEKSTITISYNNIEVFTNNELNELEDENKYETDEEKEKKILSVVQQLFVDDEKRNENFIITYPSIDGVNNKVFLTYDGSWAIAENYILNNKNCLVDYYTNRKSNYNFDVEDGMTTSFSNSPSYTNIKNDFHIWGKNSEGAPIHYHLVIKNKPKINTYKIKLDENGDIVFDNEGSDFTPEDWRVELYMQGKLKQSFQQRPDIYEQEILDLLPTIYEFYTESNSVLGRYKEDINKTNTLKYFIDYIEPTSSSFCDCSVDLINRRIHSYQQDKVVRLFNKDVPNIVFIRPNETDLKNRCDKEGQPYFEISEEVFSSNFAEGTLGYSAQEIARDLLYQYTDYNNSISFQCIPIYYLEPNTRITIKDKKAGISGDFIIKSISRPLDGQGTMSITATKALERI